MPARTRSTTSARPARVKACNEPFAHQPQVAERGVAPRRNPRSPKLRRASPPNLIKFLPSNSKSFDIGRLAARVVSIDHDFANPFPVAANLRNLPRR